MADLRRPVLARDRTGANGPVAALSFHNTRSGKTSTGKPIAEISVNREDHDIAGALNFYSANLSGDLNLRGVLDNIGRWGLGVAIPAARLDVAAPDDYDRPALGLTQNDVTNNPPVLSAVNAGSGNFIDYNGGTFLIRADGSMTLPGGNSSAPALTIGSATIWGGSNISMGLGTKEYVLVSNLGIRINGNLGTSRKLEFGGSSTAAAPTVIKNGATTGLFWVDNATLGVASNGVENSRFSAGFATHAVGLGLKEQVSAPPPDTGYGRIFAKTDGKLYFTNGAGTECSVNLTIV